MMLVCIATILSVPIGALIGLVAGAIEVAKGAKLRKELGLGGKASPWRRP